MDATRILLLAAVGAGGYLAWRRGVLAGVLPPPPALPGHVEPGAADGPAFIPWPLPGTPAPAMIENAPPAPANAPRGIRNNNPGNIEWSSETWQGAVPRASATDSRFIQFRAPEYGIRAMVRTLTTYQIKHGCRTITDIVSRWAPPPENNTPAYIKFVSDKMKQSPVAVLDLIARPELMRSLVETIIQREQGQQPYSPAMLDHGISLARG